MNWPVWGQQVNAWEIRQTLWDKTRQSLWMAQQRWPLLPFFTHRGSLTAEDPACRAFHDQHLTADGWVLKMNRGQRGVGVHFLQTEAELLSWCETLWRMGDQDFLIQPRVAQGPEYRLTLLGQKVWAVLERSSDKAVANFAQGGEARELPLADWSPELRSLIDRITAHPVAHVLSLDVLVSAQGLVISDINTVPGFEQLEAVTGRNFARDLLGVVLNS
jgi:glutathione synthase/RimK-type ligase-like ATP-grasp enzyme